MKKTIFTCMLTFMSLALVFCQGLEVNQGTQNNSNGEGGYAIIGDKSLRHVSIDDNSIQTRFDFGNSDLSINPYGGSIFMLQSGGSENLYIDGSGLFYNNLQNRVGIGTFSPNEALDVEGFTRTHGLKLTGEPNSDDGYIQSTESASADIFLVSNDNIRLDLDEDNDELGELEVFDGANNRILALNESGEMDILGNHVRLSTFSNSKSIQLNTIGNAVSIDALDADLFLTTGNSSNDVIVAPLTSNQVGIGDTQPLYKLELPNNSNTSGGQIRANDFVQYSDRRIKSNFQQLNKATDIIMQLKPLAYDQHDSNEQNGKLQIKKNESARNVGFVAQDMYKILPDLVYKPENETEDLWSISYIKLIPYLTKAVQEQQHLIEAQFSIIQELKSEMAQLTITDN